MGLLKCGRLIGVALVIKVSMEVETPGRQQEANREPDEDARVTLPKRFNNTALSDRLPGEQKQPRHENHS